jgi:hypothetical protein
MALNIGKILVLGAYRRGIARQVGAAAMAGLQALILSEIGLFLLYYGR